MYHDQQQKPNDKVTQGMIMMLGVSQNKEDSKAGMYVLCDTIHTV